MARDSHNTDDLPEKKKLPKKDKRLLAFIGFMAFVTILIGIGIAAYAAVNYFYEAPFKGQASREAVIFEVPKGSGLSSIANRLEKEALIDNAF
jgi:UPF0755 protein